MLLEIVRLLASFRLRRWPKDLPPEIGTQAAEVEAPVKAVQTPEILPAALVGEPAAPIAASSNGHAEPVPLVSGGWESGLEAEAMELLASGRHDVWEALTKRFESKLILTALANTRGRRIEAAQKLGIGRNTITRKIQELGLE